MLPLQIVLSCVEILALGLTLVFFLRKIASILDHVIENVDRISKGSKAIEDHVSIIGPGADQVNRILGDCAGGLTQACVLAEGLSK